MRIVRYAFALGVLALAFTASTASAGKLQTGFLDPAASSRGDQFEIDRTTAMQAVAKTAADGAGGHVVRLYVYWRAVAGSDPPEEPKNPNDSSYNWNANHLQENVSAAQAANLEVMLTIRSAPNWAQRGGQDGRGTHNPDPKKLAAFTAAATSKFKEVKYWGIWNEPNYKTFLSPQYKNGKLVSPGMYRNLLNAAGRVVQNKGKQVVAGETAPFSHWNSKGKPTAPGPLLFLRKLLCVDKSGHATCSKKVRADIFATHPYTSGNAFHHAFNANDVSFGDLPEWKRLIKAASKRKHITNRNDGHGVGLWITEFSWDTKPPDPKAVPTSLHARWTSEALYRTWQLGIPVLLWGQLRDYPISTDKFYGQYQSGLFFCDSTPKDGCDTPADPSTSTDKPSLQAFRFPFVAYAKNGRITVWGRTPGSDTGSVAIQKRKDGKWKPVTNATASSSGIFKKTFSSSLRKGKLRAKVASDKSVAFSLVRPKDRFVNPFGCGGVIPC